MKVSALKRAPRGHRYQEDPLGDAVPLRDPSDSWRPPRRRGLPHELGAFMRSGGALPHRAWHLLFLVAAARLDAWAGRDALRALHEDWANLMLCWRSRPSNAASLLQFMTKAFEEMLARPRPPKVRGQSRLTPLAPRILLVKYEFCRQRVAALRQTTRAARSNALAERAWKSGLEQVAHDVALYPLASERDVAPRIPRGTLRLISEFPRKTSPPRLPSRCSMPCTGSGQPTCGGCWSRRGGRVVCSPTGFLSFANTLL